MKKNTNISKEISVYKKNFPAHAMQFMGKFFHLGNH